MVISLSDLIGASRNLGDPEVVADTLLAAMSEECADCEHSVAFFSGPCSLGLRHSQSRLGRDDTSIGVAKHAQAYATSEVIWNRWSVRADERNQFRSVVWDDGGPLSKLFRATETREYRRIVICIGDRAVGHVSTIVFHASATPCWERLDAMVVAMLPALRFAGMSLCEQMTPANDVVAYLSTDGNRLAINGEHKLCRVAQEVSSHLRRMPGELRGAVLEQHQLRLCVEPELANGHVLALKQYERSTVALNARDTALVEWVERGLTNKEIASLLGTRATTIKKALERLYERTGAAGRTELVHLLRQSG